MRPDQRILQNGGDCFGDTARGEGLRHSSCIRRRSAGERLNHSLSQEVELAIRELNASESVLNFVEELRMIEHDGQESALGEVSRML